ncbi:MAG: hypothetical protein SFY56_10720 [Bacteroidota bacterium]|nr:hypothetical protein [Bacteroidota bacterium]
MKKLTLTLIVTVLYLNALSQKKGGNKEENKQTTTTQQPAESTSIIPNSQCELLKNYKDEGDWYCITSRYNGGNVKYNVEKYTQKHELKSDGECVNEITIGGNEFILKKQKIDPAINFIFLMSGTNTRNLCFIDGCFYEYKFTFFNGQGGFYKYPPYTLNVIDISIYSTDKNKVKDFLKNPEVHKLKLEQYLNTMGELTQKAEKDKEEAAQKKADDSKKAFEESYALKSIKGKDIVKIELVWLSKETETSLAKRIEFGMQATDSKGVVYKTANLGGEAHWEDFTFSADCEGNVLYNGFEAPLFCNSIKNDQITITLKSKHHPNLKDVKSIKMAYSEGIQLNYSGPNDLATSYRNGHHGESIKIYVAESANKKFNLIEIKGFNGMSKGKLKLAKNANLIIYSNGHSGKNQSGSWKGGSGGNGGDVTVYHTPGLPIDFISINNSGGNAGTGCCGSRGQDGKTSFVPQAVSLSF